jgi:hypothetical protein
MRGWGTWMVILGIGSFILPLFNLQFMLLNYLGPARPIVAVFLIVIGGAMMYFDNDEG